MKNKKGFYKTKNNNYLDLKDKTVIRILNILDSLDISDDNVTIDKNKMLYINESLKNPISGQLDGEIEREVGKL